MTELTQLARDCLAILEASSSTDEIALPRQAGELPSASRTVAREAEVSDASTGPASAELEAGPHSDPEAESAVAKPFRGDPDGGASVEENSDPPSAISRVPLALVLAACPDICDYARSEIRTPRDLCAAANLLRPLLEVTVDAWNEACRVMGREGAAIVLAVLLQRGVAIKNPGGYLRTLTRRAAAGRFSVWPMLMALNAARQKVPPKVRSLQSSEAARSP